jgi:hypothetical protein
LTQNPTEWAKAPVQGSQALEFMDSSIGNHVALLNARKEKIMQYRIVLPLMVLAFQDNHYAATTVPKGAVIELIGPVAEDSRFVTVKFNGELFHAFESDLNERARHMKTLHP